MALPTASDNAFPSMLVTETAAASISTPASGKQRLFIDTDHILKYKNSSGTVTGVDTTGGGSGLVAKIYQNKPAGNITRAATSVGAFSTAWQITSVVVASGQNVKLDMHAAILTSTADILFAIFRDSTQIAAFLYGFTGGAGLPRWVDMLWVDENPGAATYTYEIRAAAFSSGTLTVYQSNITTDTGGGSSIFVAEVYTP